MKLSAEGIYQSILLRAADEWNVEFSDLQQDLGQSFDPLVRFMAGGLASELDKVYQSIDQTEMRLQRRLARVLLPEYYHLPDPAHALATALPTRTDVLIDETYNLRYTPGEEEEGRIPVDFSPIFATRLLPIEIEVIATERDIVHASRRRSLAAAAEVKDEPEIDKIVIGFSSKVPITNWEATSMYFNLIQRRGQSGETASLLKALEGAVAKVGEQQMIATQGIARPEATLEDNLNGSERLKRSVSAFYERYLLSFRDRDIEPTEPVKPADFLREWFSRSLDTEETAERLAAIPPKLTKPIYWIEIHFGTAVAIPDLKHRLQVRFNVFPVANRSLEGSGMHEHHYLHKNNIYWLHLQPKQDFISMRRVYLDQPPDYPQVKFKPFTEFKQDSSPSYSIKHGGVGRWDDFNAWKRLSYLLSVADDNHAQHDLIDNLASNLSLDEVHALLAKRLAESPENASPTRDVYVLLHKGNSLYDARIKAEYWTSLGEQGNGVAGGTKLASTTPGKVHVFEKDTVALLTTSKGGNKPLDASHELNALKSVILSRGRIVTREDLKTFCLDFFREKLAEIDVRDGVGVDDRFNFGMTRVLEIHLAPTYESSMVDDWDGLSHELQILLNEKSSSHIPIRVIVGKPINKVYE